MGGADEAGAVDGGRARGRARLAAWHAALSETARLAIVDALALGDRTPGQLGTQLGLSSNLLAFHLDVLDDVGIVRRRRSQGDGRRRYVSLGPTAPDHRTGAATPDGEVDPGAHDQRQIGVTIDVAVDEVLFVCTHNAARSQLAAALWGRRTGHTGASAGSRPADRVHPEAVRVAARHGLDLAGARPRNWGEVSSPPGLVVSVCDRAHEVGPPFRVPRLHWSVPQPVVPADFDAAWRDLEGRVDRLALAVTA